MEVAHNLLAFNNFLHVFVTFVLLVMMGIEFDERNYGGGCLFAGLVVFSVWLLVVVNTLAYAAGVFS